jgi:hypothetical protein
MENERRLPDYLVADFAAVARSVFVILAARRTKRLEEVGAAGVAAPTTYVLL